MAEVEWKIYWNEYSFETYLYGSQISFLRQDDVEFINELMSPGTVIKKWYSRVNYQEKRTEPSLPMISGENRYHISLDLDIQGEGDVLTQIVFFDRYEKEVDKLIIREREKDFRCSLKTYSYEIRLISAGVSHFRFHSYTLKEHSDEFE